MSMSPEEAAVVKETSQNALLMATKTSEQIISLQAMQNEQMTAMQHIVGEAVNQMAENTQATKDLSITVEKVLTENSYTKQSLEKMSSDVERHNMSEETIKSSVTDCSRIVKKEAIYDKTVTNQGAAMKWIWGLLAAIIALIVKEFIK